MRSPRVRFIEREHLARLISVDQALAVAREALVHMARGHVLLPDVMYFDLAERGGEVHAKGAHITGSPYFAVKVASGYPGNAARGVPVTGGLVVVFSADTGQPHAVILDNGFLTNLRTAAVSAVAADLLARRAVRQVGLIGAGHQASLQLEALARVRTPDRVRVWNRTPGRAERLVRDATAWFDADIRTLSTVEELVRTSDLLITCTAVTSPVVRDAWVSEGTHINAVGADTPTKNEIDPQLFRRARLIVDSLQQCRVQGEMRTVLAAGILDPSAGVVELGQVAAGLRPGRHSDGEITVCDMTGLGVLDAAVASFVVDQAAAQGLGSCVGQSLRG